MPAHDPRVVVRTVLRNAIAARVSPSAVAEVGDSAGVMWREAFGSLTFDVDAPAAEEETIFDLASLTKPLATTSVILQLVADRALHLDEPVAACISQWNASDRQEVTIQDLLEHAAGLPARLVDPPPRSRREFEHDICALPLEHAPRQRSIYTDLGFILLGFVAVDRGRDLLDAQLERILNRVTAPTRSDDHAGRLAFGVADARISLTAPTRPLPDDARHGRTLVGEVHDEYGAALGGVAGHAGLFGSASAVGEFARAVLKGARGDGTIPVPLSPACVARATRKSAVPGSSRALGWDTMLPSSSCGSGMSPAAFGHVGFTGTSLWIDPVLDRYFVLLTNRACGEGTSEAMQVVRRAFHDALVKL